MTTRRTFRALAALAMVALIAAGCSSGSAENADTGTGSSPGTGSGTGTAANTSDKHLTNREKAVRFAECMRDNGVSAFPDPDPSGELTIDGAVNGSGLDPSSTAWQAAIRACRDLEPSGFTGHTRGAEQQDAALEFAQCMRDNGVKDFPDPAKDEPLVNTNRIPSAATDGGMSIINAAMQKCGAASSGRLGVRTP